MVSNCRKDTIRNPQHKSQPIQHCVQKFTIRPPAQRGTRKGTRRTDGDALGVDGAQVAVLQQVHHEVLCALRNVTANQSSGSKAITSTLLTPPTKCAACLHAILLRRVYMLPQCTCKRSAARIHARAAALHGVSCAHWMHRFRTGNMYLLKRQQALRRPPEGLRREDVGDLAYLRLQMPVFTRLPSISCPTQKQHTYTTLDPRSSFPPR